ncbi:hypothetical protein GPECTOR_149g25 [Gonium pectorale]|uniref:BTB domain-containing protein n=1 Tax=Gonium pectorale TaxID=33097 RepID=A0A150FYX9_GONPE|nr:hypothetical protein GPECTOR_149g25 [Gonium pectorale]|eukprot:KXZ42415.1 hypothetical protein GPECTOR_149g25 [Gonium pectorale]
MGRPCALLSRFFARTLASPSGAWQLLHQAVADHAVSWILHAPALPLPLRRQLLRQLLGAEGQCVLAAPASQLVHGPLALCHIISAPAKCHSLLAPDVAGYLLAAAPFGLVAAEEPSRVQHHDHHQQAADEAAQLDPAWELDAALLGAQALGAQVGHGIDGEQDGRGGAGRGGAGSSERPLSTLAVACRLLLAGGRLDAAFSAFFADLLASRYGSELSSAHSSLAASPMPHGHGLGANRSHGLGANGPVGGSCSNSGATVLRGSADEPLAARSGSWQSASDEGGATAEWPAAAPSPSGSRTTPGVTEEGITIGYRWSGSGCGFSSGSNCGLPASAIGAGGAGGADPSGGGGRSLRSPGVMTDVMAGVAGLIDAMAWRGASLRDLRSLRGSGVDHQDSMSESCTTSSTVTGPHTLEDAEAVGGRGSGAVSGYDGSASSPPAVSAAAADLTKGISEDVDLGWGSVMEPPMGYLALSVHAAVAPAQADGIPDRARRAVVNVRSGSGMGAPGWTVADGAELCSTEAPAPEDVTARPAGSHTETQAASLAAGSFADHKQPCGLAEPWLHKTMPRNRCKRLSAPAGGLSLRRSSTDSPAGSAGTLVAVSVASLEGGVQGPAEDVPNGPAAGAAAGGSSSRLSGRIHQHAYTTGMALRSVEAAIGAAASFDGRLPPYTYFGATHLMAAALAVSPDVAAAAAAASRLSGSSNREARDIAVAAAAAAAAATAAGGDSGAAAASAVASQKSEKKLPAVGEGGGGGHLPACRDLVDSGGGSVGAAVARSGTVLLGVQPSESKAQLASDPDTRHNPDNGSASGGSWDMSQTPVESLFLSFGTGAGTAGAGGCGADVARDAGHIAMYEFEDASPFSSNGMPPDLVASLAAAWAAEGAGAPVAPSGPTEAVSATDATGTAAAGVMLPSLGRAYAAGAALPGGVLSAGEQLPGTGIWGSAPASDGHSVVFAFGDEQVQVSYREFRYLRRCSPLLYGWLSRLPDPSQPVTILQVPGLAPADNCRVFRCLLGWAEGFRDVRTLLRRASRSGRGQAHGQHLPPPFQQAACAGTAAPADPSNVCPAAVPRPNVDGFDHSLFGPVAGPWPELEQLQQLWRTADYLQVDDLLLAVEDELSRRFADPSPAGVAAWSAALSLAASQRHASSRLAGLCALHFMRNVWELLADEAARGAAAAAVGVLGPAMVAEVRDRLVALVALADQDLTGGE